MTTNNHPAHGPVSLERLHQIREILSKAATQSDGGNLGYAMADAVKVIDGAITAFSAEPVAWLRESAITDIREGSWAPIIQMESQRMGVDLSESWGVNYIPLYTSQPAPVAMKDHQIRELVNDLRDIAVDYHGTQQLRERIARTVRAAMLQAGNFREIPNSSTNNCREIAETSTNEHEIETHTLLKSIEGMEVSVDVSTCDADAGHRYFGTVTEISELDTAKNGCILLVQDAKPNFKQTGNSPVTPDGWVMVPKEMTPEMMRAVQIKSELGGYAASELSGAYDMFAEFWDVAVSAAPQQEDL